MDFRDEYAQFDRVEEGDGFGYGRWFVERKNCATSSFVVKSLPPTMYAFNRTGFSRCRTRRPL